MMYSSGKQQSIKTHKDTEIQEVWFGLEINKYI